MGARRSMGGRPSVGGEGGLGGAALNGFGWDALQLRRIQAVLRAGGGVDQLDDYQWSDFLDVSEYDATNFAQEVGSTGGVLKASAGGLVYFNGQKAAAGSIIPIPNMKTSPWAIATRFKFPIAIVGVNHFVDVINMLGTNFDVALEIASARSTTVLQLIQRNGADPGVNTTATPCDATGTIGAGIALNTFYDALVVYDPIAGLLTAQIDGVTTAVSSNMTNQPTEPGRPNFNSNHVDEVAGDAMLLAFKRGA